MSELPFMQLYVSDYLGDTRHLSCEQHGAYLLLLMTMWNAKGSLPDNDAKLARIACVSLKKWRGMKVDVMAFFETADGIITHQRVDRELRKSARQTESRASAGAIGGRAKALKNNKPVVANAVANGKHLPELYRKEGAIALDPTDGFAGKVRLHRDDPLFVEIVRQRGNKHPATDREGCWYFMAEEVEHAKASISGESVH